MKKGTLVNMVLVASIVAIVVLALGIDAQRDANGERFVGSDSAATTRIEEDHPDYKPWFSSLYAPSSGEIESGLFALQAALGGVALGYCFGALRTRRRVEEAIAGSSSDGV